MATPELTAGRQKGRRRPAAGSAQAWLHAYAAVWATTLAPAGVLAVAGPTAQDPTRRLLGLALTPTTSPAPNGWHVLALAAHNIPIAAWPLLLGLCGAQASRNARRAANGLLVACLLANTLPVGAALGTYGTRLVPYIPQLPLEWAALAAGYASWAVQRKRPQRALQRLAWLALIVALLTAAATLETIAVPHSRAAPARGDNDQVNHTKINVARKSTYEST